MAIFDREVFVRSLYHIWGWIEVGSEAEVMNFKQIVEICSIAPFCFLFGLNILIKSHFMLFLRKMRKCADLSSTPCIFFIFQIPIFLFQLAIIWISWFLHFCIFPWLIQSRGVSDFNQIVIQHKLWM